MGPNFTSNMEPLVSIFFYIYDNQPFLPRLKVKILLYFSHAKEVRKANYHTYKRIYH